MQCTNHLKQLGIGLHNFHDTKGKLPSGSFNQSIKMERKGYDYNGSDPYSMYPAYSVFVMLLPFMEAVSQYDQMGQETTDAAGKPFGNGHDGLASTLYKPTTFNCPSDSSSGLLTKNSSGVPVFLAGSYRGCWGDRPLYRSKAKTRGLFGIGEEEVYGLEGAEDGTSNTLAFSEAVVGNEDNQNKIKGGITQVDMKPGGTDGKYSEVVFADISAAVGTNQTINNPYTGTQNNRSGVRWSHSQNNYTAFYTLMPPNSVSIWHSNNELWCAIAVTSNHSGGANAALTDGSVRFISETIDCGPSPSTITSFAGFIGGESPRGVWGALGSRKGGESKGL